LGFVDMDTFEGKVSHLQHNRIVAGQEPLSAEELRRMPEYESAVKLFNLALEKLGDVDQVSTFALGRAYVMGQEWEKVEECRVALERDPATAKLATELSAMATKHAAKVGHGAE
jgi:hypothetical protein